MSHHARGTAPTASRARNTVRKSPNDDAWNNSIPSSSYLVSILPFFPFVLPPPSSYLLRRTSSRYPLSFLPLVPPCPPFPHSPPPPFPRCAFLSRTPSTRGGHGAVE
eukprot:3969798-Pyramimonas_sp.AAC.1